MSRSRTTPGLRVMIQCLQLLAAIAANARRRKQRRAYRLLSGFLRALLAANLAAPRIRAGARSSRLGPVSGRPGPRGDFTTGRRLCDEPLVHLYDELLTPVECAHIIELARPKMRRSQVSGPTGGQLSQGRTNALTWVRHDTDEVVLATATRIAARVGLPLAHAESLQVIHYEAGQEYRPHFDAYDMSTEKGQRYTQRGGQRLVTALAYLGAVEGGTTSFPRLGLDIVPATGRVLVWHNCHPGTTVCDPHTYHHGKPPLRGDKWAFNLWFHERPYWPA